MISHFKTFIFDIISNRSYKLVMFLGVFVSLLEENVFGNVRLNFFFYLVGGKEKKFIGINNTPKYKLVMKF